MLGLKNCNNNVTRKIWEDCSLYKTKKFVRRVVSFLSTRKAGL